MANLHPNKKGLKKGWELSKMRKNPLNKKICAICGKIFYCRGKRKQTAKCCSLKCINQYRKGKSYPKKNSIKVKRECLFCKKPFYVFPADLKKGGGKFCSIECRNKLWNGRNHPLYKGNSRSEKNAIYHSKEYQNWRMKVFVRDNFTCVECKQVGGELQAHHIKTFALCSELRFILTNGITLCKGCHKETESYLKWQKK